MADAKIATSNYGPKCPNCGTDGFDDWWHDPTTKSFGGVLKARLKCHGCGKFFSTTRYSDGVTHSVMGFSRPIPDPSP